MKITTVCPHCGWWPEYSAKKQGKRVACPECGKKFVAVEMSRRERLLSSCGKSDRCGWIVWVGYLLMALFGLIPLLARVSAAF